MESVCVCGGDPVGFNDPEGTLKQSVASFYYPTASEEPAPEWYEQVARQEAYITTWTARRVLESTIEQLSDDCLSALNELAGQLGGAMTKQMLLGKSQSLRFYDVDGPEGYLTMSQIGYPVPASRSMTIKEFTQRYRRPGDIAAVATYVSVSPNGRQTDYTSPIVFLYADYFLIPPPPGVVPAHGMVLLHEELHYILNKDDAQIRDALKNVGFGSTADPSIAFSQWLGLKCGGAK